MRIEGAEMITVELPLVAPFRTSHGTAAVERKLLVRLDTDAGSGWGECAAQAAPLYTSEDVDGARHVTRAHLLPRLIGPDLTPERVAQRLQPVRGHRMAKAALEMAVLDAWGRRTVGRSPATSARPAPRAVRRLGGYPAVDRRPAGGGRRLPGEGYRRIKLKIKPGWDVAPVEAVRERFGDLTPAAGRRQRRLHPGRRPDSWRRLDAFDLLLIEQPLAEDDIRQHAELARLIRTPICLDESVVSVRAAADAIALRAAQVINIKAGRVGGYLDARRIHDLCQANGIPVWCGGMLETGLGRAANAALAALPGFTLPGDVSASDRFYDQDITAPFVLEDGEIAVPTGPGLGVTVDEDALAAAALEREVWRPS